jgi:hypothetical protein
MQNKNSNVTQNRTGLRQYRVLFKQQLDDEQIRSVRLEKIYDRTGYAFFVRHYLRMVSESISEIFTHRLVFME